MQRSWKRLSTSVLILSPCCGLALAGPAVGPGDRPATKPLEPIVEIEESVYSYEPANNGAGPMWCQGSTCLVRIGEGIYASGLETLTNARPLNNCRWMLFRRESGQWEKVQFDAQGRTREPCPLAAFAGGPLWLSANPTLVEDPKAYGGRARPELLRFDPSDPRGRFQQVLPQWQGGPPFTEHSYRSFAADGESRALILFQNIDYTHAEWAFLGPEGRWTAAGRLNWPWGAEYEKPQPIRVCYPDVALRKRAVHFCGVSDIVEPNPEWRAYKKAITGREWDYDFRRLFYTWTPDVTTTPFRPWIEIASREKTCGWISPGDLWVGPDGTVHLLWTERALDERLREKFFPGERQRHILNYALLRDGRVLRRHVLQEAVEKGPGEVPGRGRFQVTPDQRLFAVYYVSGRDAAGRGISENRIVELKPDGPVGPAVRIPFRHPFTDFFTATVRAGSPPSRTLELLGTQPSTPAAIHYARVRLD